MCHYFFDPGVRLEWESTFLVFLVSLSEISVTHILFYNLHLTQFVTESISLLATVETMRVVEAISDECLIFHQVHKRVWPAAQRDALFWSHIRCVPDAHDEDAHDVWIVCNNSTDYVDVPVSVLFLFLIHVSKTFLLRSLFSLTSWGSVYE